MNNWKEAYWLTKFEIKHAKARGWYFLGTIFFVLFLVVPTVPEYLESSSLGLDMMFLLLFTAIPVWVRPLFSQAKKVSGFLWAPHILVALNQLPPSKDTIIKYRFLSYIIVSTSFQVIFLTCLYILTPSLREMMTPGIYVVFSILWLSFTFYLGTLTVKAEAGSNLILNIIIAIFLAGPLMLIILTFLFYKEFYDKGLVQWTMHIANTQPLLSVIVSIVLAIIGWNFWMYRMKRRMNRVDYF